MSVFFIRPPLIPVFLPPPWTPSSTPWSRPFFRFSSRTPAVKIRRALRFTPPGISKMNDSRHGSSPDLEDKVFVFAFACTSVSPALLPQRRRTVRCVTHNHSNDAAGQNNLEI